jgi:hypothetical protein
MEAAELGRAESASVCYLGTIVTKTIAAALTGILLGILTNLVSNYFAPMANKSRRLTWSAFAGLAVLTLMLAVVSDGQILWLQDVVGSSASSLLEVKYGWALILLLVILLGTALSLLARHAFRLIIASALDTEEKAYLQGLIADIDRLNGLSNWKEDYYVEARSEVVDQIPTVTPSYYLVQKLNPGVKKNEFEALPNAEKVENSRGLTYSSFKRAARRATDNAVVVLSAPGGGKTVTLRRLAREYAQERLRNGIPTPIFINLAYYTGWRSLHEVEPFESFLESYFASGYTGWLSERRWEKLLREGRCVFLLDGLDEIPRGTREHHSRLEEVERFVRAWPNTKFYLSCRELDYDYRLGFQQILIKPFDLRRVRHFLKLYFEEEPDLYKVGSQVWLNSSLFELAKVPFYLNLLSGYIRRRREVPSNKSELFTFVIEQVIAREMGRQGTKVPAALEESLVRILCDLAAEMSLTKMTSTLSLEEFLATGRGADRDEILSVIEVGIRGGLMELDRPTSKIRFAHHRFQEFFCALYLTDQYRKPSLSLPPDFFLSIWWRETILMEASIDSRPADFVKVMLDHASAYAHQPASVAAAMQLAVLALAHECLLSNSASRDDEMASNTRDALITRFPTETPMGKVAIVNALSEDSSPLALALLERAANDESVWVSEKAFFVRSAGAGRFRPTLWSASKEFARFLIAGRIFANAPDVVSLAARFKNLRWLLPLYALFALVGLGAIAAVSIILFSVGRFLMFDLQYSLDERCLGCLASISVTIGVLTYLFTRRRPWLQRFLLAAPAALMCWFLVFNIPSNLVLKMAAFGLGTFFLSLVRRRWPDQGGDGSVLAFVSGAFVASFFYNAFAGRLGEVRGPSIASVPVGVSMAWILLVVLAAGAWLLRDLLIIRTLRRTRQQAGEILEDNGPSSEAIDRLMPLFTELGSASWAQRALLDQLIAYLSNDGQLAEADRLDFLLRLASNFPPSRFRDVLYQRCEEVSDNFRRSLGRPTRSLLPEA